MQLCHLLWTSWETSTGKHLHLSLPNPLHWQPTRSRFSVLWCKYFPENQRATKGRRSPTEPCGRKPISLTDAKSYAVYDLHSILRAVIYDLQKPGLTWTRTKRSRISEDAKNSTKCNYVFSHYEYGFESVIYVIEFSQFSVTKGFRLVSFSRDSTSRGWKRHLFHLVASDVHVINLD